MKHAALIVVALVVAVATYSATAWSAAPPSPAEKQLLKDVKTLKAKVAKLQADSKKLTTRVAATEDGIGGAYLLGVCQAAITADALQGTWQIVDQLSAATQAGKTYFGPQTPVDDSIGGQPVCQALQVIRSQALPPTVAQFNALLALLRS
jgi:outer membrane murein-binding lipoprotein Lpp